MARTLLVRALVCLALLLAETAAAQDLARKYPIDIPAQGLTTALEKLSVQTDIYYGFSPESEEQEKLRVGPVRGQYTIDEALNLLLQSTGFTFTRIDSKNIAIVKAPPALPKVNVATPPPRAATNQLRTESERSELAARGILERVVTERSRLTYLPAPTSAGFVIEREEIKRTGATTVMDLLRLIPQQPFLRPDGFRSNGAQYAELRGLGPDTTLVLINGRRAFASAASFIANAFDLNQLPLSAVEHVEVQLDSISVRHGADAIGGIVNIVMRDDVADPTVELRYGAAAGGGEQSQAAVSLGYRSENSHGVLILDYRDVRPLLGVERELWRNQDYRRFGSADLRSTVSSPANVFALPDSLLSIGAPFAAVPERTAGPVTDLSEYLPFELNRDSLLQYSSIVTEDRRASAVARIQGNVTEDVVASADLMVVDRHVLSPSVPALLPVLTPTIVPSTNPYNGFGQPVIVLGFLNGVDPTLVTLDSLLVRGSGSLRGKVKDWGWELSLLRSEEDAQVRLDNIVDPTRLALALNDSDPDQTLNLLGPGPAASPEVLASVLQAPDIDTFAADATQLTGVVSGGLFKMPAGEVAMVLGTEWRKEAAQFDALVGAVEREVAVGFAELEVPLFGGDMQFPAARELTLTVAGRFDSFTDFGEIFSPQYGLVWRPLRDVTIRATYGRSFRPPSLYDLYLPRELSPMPAPLVDPRRSGDTYSTTQLTGGDRELEATHGESFAAGIEFAPSAITPLKLSATYWHVMMDDRVIALNPLFAVTHESQLANRVQRAQPTPSELAAGLPGRIVQIDVTRMNFGRLTTSGIDVGASYEFELAAGHFAADIKGTWIDEYEALDLPGVPPADRVNVANSLGTIAKWRAITSLDWQRGAFGATAYVRYIPSYDDTRDSVRNGRTISSQTFLDLQFAVDMGKLIGDSALLRGVEFTAGAYNAFDEHPDFAEVNGLQGYDTSQGDLKGRFWYVRLGKTF